MFLLFYCKIGKGIDDRTRSESEIEIEICQQLDENIYKLINATNTDYHGKALRLVLTKGMASRLRPLFPVCLSKLVNKFGVLVQLIILHRRKCATFSGLAPPSLPHQFDVPELNSDLLNKSLIAG